MALSDQQLDDKPDFLEQVRGFATRFERYRRTKRAVRSGQRVWELSRSERTVQGLAGPWEFTLLESALAALPALAVAKLLRLLFSERPEITAARATLTEIARAAQDNLQYLLSLVTPLTLFAFVTVAARASLHKADSTPERRQLARRAYLYLDGGHGLLPQAIASFALAVQTAVTERAVPFAGGLLAAASLLLYASAFWNLSIVGRKVPRLLFAANGYSSEIPRLFSIKHPPNAGPWTRYSLSVLFLGPALIWGIVLAALAAAYLWAWLVIRAQALLSSAG